MERGEVIDYQSDVLANLKTLITLSMEDVMRTVSNREEWRLTVLQIYKEVHLGAKINKWENMNYAV